MKVIKVQPWGEGQGEFVLINEDEFDANVHKLLEEVPAVAKASKGLNVDEIKGKLTQKGIAFAETAKKPELAKLLDEAPE